MPYDAFFASESFAPGWAVSLSGIMHSSMGLICFYDNSLYICIKQVSDSVYRFCLRNIDYVCS